MEFTATFQIPVFRGGLYRAVVHEAMARAIAEATRVWLGATVELIPVWSGASRATFVPLASEVDFHVSISPVSRTRYSLGLNNADGSVTSDGTAGLYQFTYSTSLAHLIWNEYHNANIDRDPTLFGELIEPGPYKFQEAGKEAFNQFATTVRMPDPLRFFTAQEVRVP